MTAVATPAPVRFFLERFGLNERMLEQIVGGAIARHADYADLYFEFRTVQSLSLEDGIVKSANQHVSQGVGVRVVAGDKTGYAYSDDVTVDSLQLATRTAQAIAAGRAARRAPVAVRADAARRTTCTRCRTRRWRRALDDKIDLLNRIDIAARRHDPRIKNVMASIGVEQKFVLIVSAAGLRRRRRAAAGAPERHLHRRGGRQAPAGHVRRRRPRRVRASCSTTTATCASRAPRPTRRCATCTRSTRRPAR